MPALVNRSVGSSLGSRDEEGTSRCPRATKKSRNRRLIWEERIGQNIGGRSGISYQLPEGARDRLQRLASRESPPGEERQEPAALGGTRQGAELRGALGGERRREGAAVGPRRPLLGDRALHVRPGHAQGQEIARKAGGAAAALGPRSDVVPGERRVIQQSRPLRAGQGVFHGLRREAAPQ